MSNFKFKKIKEASLNDDGYYQLILEDDSDMVVNGNDDIEQYAYVVPYDENSENKRKIGYYKDTNVEPGSKVIDLVDKYVKEFIQPGGRRRRYSRKYKKSAKRVRSAKRARRTKSRNYRSRK